MYADLRWFAVLLLLHVIAHCCVFGAKLHCVPPPLQDEMAAILRFGAEQLFEEDDQQAKESSKQMMEEDIDAILGRAEVVDAGVEKNEVSHDQGSAPNCNHAGTTSQRS